MTHVDALNRNILYINALPIERELEYRQLADSKLKQVASKLEVTENENFELIDGLVYRKGVNKISIFPRTGINDH